ncbi:hypothetical protein JD844_017887 [Phrynosoma platyrhinos]|uniref:DUF5580 domain-containing protein n=1 Tax=Phrynosoma platyrhinos TaxID=52577 RepID=A0ABQ7SMK3_PHRPL|nr:hypothetical protein JD844_017887 [Phrynosoma platyrhinos]
MLQTLAPCNTRQTRGNAPSLNKPPCQQINYVLNDEQQNKGEKEEHKSKQGEMNDSRTLGSKGLKPGNMHCATAPSGDKSLSYIHTLKNTSIEPQTSRQHERQANIMEDSRETYEEKDSLLTVLKKELELHSLSLTKVDKLREECNILDPKVSGFLSQALLSYLLLKHEVPLQLPTVKLLFKKFSNANYPELVNYKKLFQFLRLVAESTMQQTHSLPEKTQHVKKQRKRFYFNFQHTLYCQ